MAELEEYGVRDFSLRRVASRVGVSRTAPYRHFASKQDLLGALSVEGFRVFTRYLASADAECGGSSFDRLLAQGRAYLAFGEDHPQLLELIFSGEGMQLLHERVPSATDLELSEVDGFGVLERRVAECQAEGSLADGIAPSVLAMVIWSSVHGIATLKREGVFAGAAADRGVSEEEANAQVMAAFARVFGRSSGA